MRIILFILACSFCAQVVRSEDRFRVDAKINGKPARLIFDTGCSPSLVLFKPSAERLGLIYSALPPDKRRTDLESYWITDESAVTLRWSFWSSTQVRWQLGVIEFPSYTEQWLQMDGALGWSAVSKNIIEFDASKRKFKFLYKVPNRATRWLKLALRNNLPPEKQWLVMTVRNSDATNEVIIVDTGSVSGVGLPPHKWREWKAAHTNQPVTLVAGYMAEPGLMVQEQSWAKEISLGQLELTDVTIEEAPPMTLDAVSAEQTVTFGMSALKRLEFIVDGKQGVAYLRPKTKPAAPPHFEPNPPVLVFVPRDAKSDDLVAHVLAGGSAYEAGIRNGDVVLEIDDHDVAQWRADPGEKWRIKPDSPFITPSTNSPPGTKLELVLKRGDETLKANVDLQAITIFAPQTNSPPSGLK